MKSGKDEVGLNEELGGDHYALRLGPGGLQVSKNGQLVREAAAGARLSRRYRWCEETQDDDDHYELHEA